MMNQHMNPSRFVFLELSAESHWASQRVYDFALLAIPLLIALVVGAIGYLYRKNITYREKLESQTRLAQLGETVARVVPGTEVVSEENSSDVRSYNVSFSRAAGELGFECLTTVEQGVEETADALRAGRFGSYKDPIYSNVAALQDSGQGALASRG